MRMTAFTEQDIDYLLQDLQLYSGNIRDVSDLHGPHSHNGGTFGGVIHTWMDSFNFSASPMFCDEQSWTIDLPDPIESLRCGHRMLVLFSFPKLHKDPALQHRYRIANIIYHAYDGYSNVSEASRLPEYERVLGYEHLPSYGRVLEAIVRDFRSFHEKKRDRARAQYARNQLKKALSSPERPATPSSAVAWKTTPPQTWGDWHTLLRKKWLCWQSARFPDTDPMTAQEMRQLLFKSERQHVAAVEKVIEQFAGTGRWPWGSSEHRYFLSRRIEYAMEILSALGLLVYGHDNSSDPSLITAHEPVMPPTQPEIIAKWLLRDCWEWFGRERWIDKFILARSR